MEEPVFGLFKYGSFRETYGRLSASNSDKSRHGSLSLSSKHYRAGEETLDEIGDGLYR